MGSIPEIGSPIEEIVRFAIDQHDQDEFTDSTAPGEPFHTKLWTFTRAIKSCFPADTDSAHVFDLVAEVVVALGGFEELLGIDEEEAFVEFVYDWDKVRYRMGGGPLDNAMELAELHPVRPPHGKKRGLVNYGRFVSIAVWLQYVMGDRIVMLPCEKLAEILGVCPMTITRYRSLAEKQGLLQIKREHSYGRRRATEFRINLDVLDMPGEGDIWRKKA